MINPAIETAILSHIGVGDLPDDLNELIAALQTKHYKVAIAIETALCAHIVEVAKRSFEAGWNLAKCPEKLIFGYSDAIEQLDNELEEIVRQIE